MLQLTPHPAPGKELPDFVIVHEVAGQAATMPLLPEAGKASATRGALRDLVISDYLCEAFLGTGTTVGSSAILGDVELPRLVIQQELGEKKAD